ncbi:hypothetical protein OHC33_006054 [Knufia fluminis]|uniref:Uncharacterized protein n=1 Tax=Knufia fluminis TaxID=191047 RepID=A0AAN8EV74_9EURO|nr:hypothetical protein OHC33_006054 [Knufia fluminis]
MVGKVVGKRRKRPLPDSKTNLHKSTQWNITVGPTALPSPAPSVASEQQNKRPCLSGDWTSMIAYDDQTTLDFSQCDEQQFLNLELAEETEQSTTDDSLNMMYGIPTPSMSPPEMQFLSPADLEARNHARPYATASFHATPQATCHLPTSQTYQPQPEDDETVCIKLLAHMKRFSTQNHTFVSMLTIINKTNSALRRLLQSRTIRTDYTCQLLLTNIVLHLATFSERLLDVPEPSSTASLEEEFIHEAYLTEGETPAYSDQRPAHTQAPVSRSIAKHSIRDATMLCSAIGDLLKRKPLNGFQILGRHESAHVEIDTRLRRVLASLL